MTDLSKGGFYNPNNSMQCKTEGNHNHGEDVEAREEPDVRGFVPHSSVDS